MDLQLKAKKVLVTGSTAGIGFATAQKLAGEGASVGSMVEPKNASILPSPKFAKPILVQKSRASLLTFRIAKVARK